MIKNKNTKWFNAAGCINVERDITRDDVDEILSEPEIFQIQFQRLPDPQIFDVLNTHFFTRRPDVRLRVWGYGGHWADLSFLVHLSNLEHFYIDEYLLKDLSPIAQLPKLQSLIIGSTKSTAVSLKPLENLPLTFFYVEGKKKHLEVISTFVNLKELVLRSITLDTLEILLPLKSLEQLRILLGGTTNLAMIPDLENLKYLELWLIRKLTDLDFISEATSLQQLALQALRNVERLPSFKRLGELRRIRLNTMKGLKDISSLAEAPILEDFVFISAQNFQPEDFKILIDHPTLKRATVGFGSDKRNNKFRKMMDAANIKPWKPIKFVYK